MGSGYSTGMELKTILANIDWRLRQEKLTDNEASDRAGDAIRNMRRRVKGRKPGSPKLETLEKIAAVLHCTARDLMQPIPEENVRPIPGLKGQLLSQLAYLEQERARVLQQLAQLEQAEIPAEKPRRKKIR